MNIHEVWTIHNIAITKTKSNIFHVKMFPLKSGSDTDFLKKIDKAGKTKSV